MTWAQRLDAQRKPRKPKQLKKSSGRRSPHRPNLQTGLLRLAPSRSRWKPLRRESSLLMVMHHRLAKMQKPTVLGVPQQRRRRNRAVAFKTKNQPLVKNKLAQLPSELAKNSGSGGLAKKLVAQKKPTQSAKPLTSNAAEPKRESGSDMPFEPKRLAGVSLRPLVYFPHG